ncbi:MAG: 30S ribosomal protein S17 [Gammaproteobacteria bacterium]
MAEEKKGSRSLIGEVISNKMDKTVAVKIERVVKHPLYRKYIKRSTRLLAHDESNACQEGDIVEIAECRPLSKRKSMRVTRVLERAKQV